MGSNSSQFRLCAVVILYYPDIKDVVQNIQRYMPWIRHLVIWDNTPMNSSQDIRTDLMNSLEESKITYISSGKNEGIAYALNKATEWAYKNGYTHLLTMDQDSRWTNFDYYLTEIKNHYNEETAAFAPLIHDCKRNITGFNNILQFITSGAIYNITVLIKLGGFCEEFMIDNVDTEYALRLRYYKFKIEIIEGAILYQEFGTIKKIPILGCYHANYSEFRLFHILRNNIWTWRMYKKTHLLPKNFLSFFVLYKYIVREPILILISGNRKTSKLVALIKGLLSGFFKYPRALDKYLS